MANNFDRSRMEQTDLAHHAALEQIYPILLNGMNYYIEDVAAKEGNRNARTEAFDFHLGVDSIIHFNGNGIQPMILTVQERFREPCYQKYQDITITTGNNKTHQTGEAEKLAAQLFLYGYFCKEENRFIDAIAVNVMNMIMALHRQEINARRQKGNEKEQPFMSIKFDDLHRSKSVWWHLTQKEQFDAKRMMASIHHRIDDQENVIVERISALEQAFIAKEKTEQAILQALNESNRMLLKLQYQSLQKPMRRGNVTWINGNLPLEESA